MGRHAMTHQKVQRIKVWNQGPRLDGFSGGYHDPVSVAVAVPISEEHSV
jgi:hypothetical protein